MPDPKEVITALQRARDTAMKFTLRARIPECGEFGAIAQDLDFALTALTDAGLVVCKGEVMGWRYELDGSSRLYETRFPMSVPGWTETPLYAPLTENGDDLHG